MTTADMNRLSLDAAQEADRLDAEAVAADERAALCRTRVTGAAPGERERHLLDVLVAENSAYWLRADAASRRKVAASWAREAKQARAAAA